MTVISYRIVMQASGFELTDTSEGSQNENRDIIAQETNDERDQSDTQDANDECKFCLT